MAGLASFLQRGVLDWQRELSGIADAKPPLDDESAGVIEHALTDPVMTRFFVESAELPEWIEWLDGRGQLKRLFNDGDLPEQDAVLCHWLARRFAVKHPDALLSVILRHRGRLNSHLWDQLAWQLRHSDGNPLDALTLSKWVHLLITCVPPQADDYVLSHLAETCAQVGVFQNLLQAYDAMTAYRSQVRLGLDWDAAGNRQYLLKTLWEGYLKPNLPHIARLLLERTIIRLEERHSAMQAWDRASETWDTDSHSRSAIEPHEQDHIPHSVDSLIDVARGCLEWLADNDLAYVGAWCGRIVGSDAPLLRRLAIHAMTERNDLTADDKIAWLLEHCDVNENAAHHEIFRAVAHAYPQASPEHRRALIKAVSKYQIAESEDYDSNDLSAYHRFNWFYWLHTADPGCIIAKDALDSVRTEHPEFKAREHPDFTHYWWTGEATSPCDANTLLMQPPIEVLPEVLTYQPDDRQKFDGHDRSTLLRAIEEAARTQPSWGLDLADAMVELRVWDSYLWRHVLVAWVAAELDHDGVKRVLYHLSADELHAKHPQRLPIFSASSFEVLPKWKQRECWIRPMPLQWLCVRTRPQTTSRNSLCPRTGFRSTSVGFRMPSTTPPAGWPCSGSAASRTMASTTRTHTAVAQRWI